MAARRLRTAETEKYAHVTYFFNGGIEVPYPGEERILVPSQKVATYDLMPEMSAPGITDVLCSAIETRSHDFILCNYANGDMVGHTGSIPGDAQGRGDGGRVPNARRRRRGARGRAAAHHGGSRQLRADDRPGDRRTAHGAHDEPGSLPRRRSRGRR